MNVYGLIGFPLGHSFSKEYFTRKFENAYPGCRFENFPLADISLFPALLESQPHLKGLCVTIPYKEKVIPFLHELSPEVQQTGACNSIRIEKDRLTGFNTDIIGFKKSLLKQLQPYHKSALILGTGGASKAVKYVLQELGITFTLVSRYPGKNDLSYTMLDTGVIKNNLLIINTTPVGTFPNTRQCPDIPYQAIGASHFLFDLIYNPEKTLFLQKGEENGAAIQNGYDMLITQAEASWELWGLK